LTVNSSAKNGMGVIFDLDGVLVDTSGFHRQAWYDLAQKEGFQMSDGFFRSTFGMQNYQILPMLAGRKLPADEISRLSHWKEKRYRELIKGKLSLDNGIKVLLEKLRDIGFVLAVGTSTPRVNLDFILAQLNIDCIFDVCVAAEDVEHGKPAPDTFLKAAEKLSLPPGRCVVVEDAVQGVQAGKNAGMPVVALTTTRNRADLQQADLIVESLSVLKADDFVKLLTTRNQ